MVRGIRFVRNFFCIGLIFCCMFTPIRGEQTVKIGLENLLDQHLGLLEGKRVGIIANHTSLDAKGQHIVELLAPHAEITALFGPEHGFFGDAEDAVSIKNTVYKNIKIFSLYGDYLAPSSAMLKDIDVLIYDIQDVGVKFYTFISNLFLTLDAAKQLSIPVIVLDRPNPINADIVDGAITNPAFASFVGVIPLPIRYGMTVGELADLFNNETYAGFSLNTDLTVIEMSGYKRSMWFDDTDFPWTATSPNMPDLETAVIYPGMCLIEGTNLSEGRGTSAPFLTIGADFIDPVLWLRSLPPEVLAGVKAEPIEFIPRSIPGKISKPRYQGKKCKGLRFSVSDRGELEPIGLTVALLCAAQKLYPQQFKMTKYLDTLWGNERLRAMVSGGSDYKSILNTYISGVLQFKKIRKKYLRYD